MASLMSKEAVRVCESVEREQEQQTEHKMRLKGHLVFVPEMAELLSGLEDGEQVGEGEPVGGGQARRPLTRHLVKLTRPTQLSNDNWPGLGLEAPLPASLSALWTARKQATRVWWDEGWPPAFCRLAARLLVVQVLRRAQQVPSNAALPNRRMCSEHLSHLL